MTRSTGMRINPNNFDKRQLQHIPPYFTKFQLDRDCVDHEKKSMATWIYENCSGRFAIIDDVQFGNSQPTKRVTSIGFEEESELTLFILSGSAQKKMS